MKTQATVTPMAFVRAIALAYESRGLDAAGALAQARIAPGQLADPQARITAAQMEAVSAAAMQELDDEALGWFSRRLPWGSYGMLCRASNGAATLGLALRRWCRHHRLLTEDALLALAVVHDEARLTITERRDFGALREFCLVTLLRYVHGYACWAVDSRMPLRRVDFPFPAPPHAEAYAHMFPGPVRFGAAQAGFSFDAAYLALPLRRDEAALCAMLQRALPLTVLQYRRDRLLAQRVRELLHTTPGATAEQLARALHLSTRSLHRQLQEERQPLQQLKDAVRRDLATEQLLRSRRPIKQIALASGFASEKSFTRAFRQWTGATPSEARERAGL